MGTVVEWPWLLRRSWVGIYADARLFQWIRGSYGNTRLRVAVNLAQNPGNARLRVVGRRSKSMSSRTRPSSNEIHFEIPEIALVKVYRCSRLLRVSKNGDVYRSTCLSTDILGRLRITLELQRGSNRRR